MSLSLHSAAVPGFIDLLTNIGNWLDKAAAQIGEGTLIEARLAPDMLPLARQVQVASDTAKGAVARLTGTEAPAMPDTETSFAELKTRCDNTVAYLRSVDPAAIEAGAGREIVMTFPNGGGMRFDAITYLTRFAIPNFYFHASMAYGILRAQGVELGKPDYLAGLASYMFAPPQPVEA